ncbi:hypothetical protein KZ483_20755 [Paenibacillus sp. sptzw28]|uniref:hypothetical protein n=1 Tax=Paenibacillus sp. sptzw28 TaxID=715179 RepID=UPI001C6DD9D0|nr:hypothetical protein [Paenibacillus sp. sptzw28]QYR20243.1 hypothetical protein KZ483_20755 [Paenibacillus sp. sptzw28]
MHDKVIWSLGFLIFIVWGAVIIVFPEFMYKTTATNTLKKKPSRAAVLRFKIGGYVMLSVGFILVGLTWLGWL